MTTKPKARKFRIRRTAPSGAGAGATAATRTPPSDTPDSGPATVTPETLTRPAAPGQTPPETQIGVPPEEQPGAQLGDIASARETTAETDIDAIRKEGLTGRQLRMARRVAQKHGLAPISDFDAVRQLRSRGIDPFQRSNMLELVVPNGNGGGDGGKKGAVPVATGGEPPNMGNGQLPQTVQMQTSGLPSTDTMSPSERRQVEIMQIQRDIARRRRRRLALLFTRLSAFVFIPTILAGWYYFVIATPMYASHTEFMILKADGGAGAGMGGLLPSNYATSQDSIAVQSYMLSKDAMLRLDAEHGFKAHFSGPSIDPIQRLRPDASNEKAHKLYKKTVKIGYDPTEGVVRMEVIAADPKVAHDFSELLVQFAEERVDELSREKREDAMATALESLEEAKIERRRAQQTLVQLQETQGVDPTEQLAVLRQQIATYETELLDKELQLAALLDNPRPNRAKVDGARGDISRLNTLLKTLNARMTDQTENADSLAARSARVQMAQADLVTSDLFLQNALQAAKQAQLEASKQVRYLTVPVMPIQAQEAAYPRSFENTVLAFLIFSGVYLMVSLTSSILREQVSS
jgi:capsular polysaccharide transport system permease protein